jgi:hypothetical protein
MTALLVHLSDIHFRQNKPNWVLDKAALIAACTYSSLPDATAVFVVVSGDIAFSGMADEYLIARQFLDAIKSEVLKEKTVPLHFVFAPGNHDCNFKRDNAARRAMLESARADIQKLEDNTIVDFASEIQSEYRDFEKQLLSAGETRSGDKLWTSHRFTVEGNEIVFDTINVSWCSSLHEEQGTIIFPTDRYQKKLGEAADLRIAVIHHPLNWFAQPVYHGFRKLVRSVANVVVSGHEHVGGVGEDLNSASGHSAYLEGCVLQSDEGGSDSSFNVAILNLEEKTYLSTRYQWSNDHYAVTSEGSWEGFRKLPQKVLNDFSLAEPFEQSLLDPGGAFGGKDAQLTLASLYVYPDMQETLERVESRRIVSTNTLLDPINLYDGVVLTGEEKVGATSLLFMLFREYYDKGFVPLYLRGQDLRGWRPTDIDSAIRSAVIEQYGEHSLERFTQTPGSRKVLLLDDYDETAVKAESQRADQLALLRLRFKHLVVTASEVFDYEASIQPHIEVGQPDFSCYRLLPMGYVLRGKLVRRWFRATEDDGSLTEDQFLARCDQVERLLNAVMSKNIVPALPLYLLTLLQSYGAGTSSEFDESGLGEYYEFLVREGMRGAGVPKTKWGSVIEYCCHLAWEMHRSENRELSEAQMAAFNDRYSREEIKVDLAARTLELTRSRILSKSGEYYRFRYHYIYYFLKGRYIESRMRTDESVMDHVRDCCAHLYVRENANTILFLAHHAFKDPGFLDLIVQSLAKPFADYTPIEFSGADTKEMGGFIQDLLPKLVYGGQSPESVREDMKRRRDQDNPQHDGLAEKKREDASENFAAQLMALLKTVEILGQILRNQIAGVSRARRVELLRILMQGPLRAVNAYLNVVMEAREELLNQIEQLLEKKGEKDAAKRRDFASKLVAYLVQSGSYSFVMKAVTSISAEGLQDDIDEAAKTLGTPAASLIAVGTRLDTPKPLPRAEMDRVRKASNSDIIATRVLQLMALRRLYMFKTTEKDKQWLSSENLVDIRVQHAIEYRTAKTKQTK